MQSGFGELLTQGTGSADFRVRRMCTGIDSLWPALWTSLDVPGVEPTNNGAECAIRPAVLPACRPVAHGEFRHAVREWCTVCRRHADGRGDLPHARTGPLRLPGRGLHREHGRPCRPPAPPRSRLIPGCLQATPDVAGPVTWCAFPTDPRERLPWWAAAELSGVRAQLIVLMSDK